MPIYRRCRSCERKILWAVTESGKRMPVDYDMEISKIWHQAIETKTDVIFNPKTMISHFSTCPDADKFRKPKNKEGA